MNYLEIVLNGFFDKNNNANLVSYFYREWKKAESQYFEINEFINGCLNVIESFKNNSKSRLHERKKELLFMLNAAKSGTLTYADNTDSRNIQLKHKETIEYCNKELNEINESNFPVHLCTVTNGTYSDNLHYFDVLRIALAIEVVRLKQSPQPEQNKKTDIDIENFVNELFMEFQINKDIRKDFINVLKNGTIKKKIEWNKSSTILIAVIHYHGQHDIKNFIQNYFNIDIENHSLDTQISRIAGKNNNNKNSNSTKVKQIFNKHLIKNQHSDNNSLKINT